MTAPIVEKLLSVQRIDYSTRKEAADTIEGLLAALEEAVFWDGRDEEGVDAVWLEKAKAAIAKAKAS